MDNVGNVVVALQSVEDLDGTAGTDSDAYPKITTDRDGNWLTIWNDSNAFSSSVSTDNGQTWSPLVNVHEGIMSGNSYSSIPIVY